MTVTYEQFAEFLLKHSNFYYRPHETVYCYIREDGAVRYFANWGYGETRDYASLKSLMEATTGRDLPDPEDLAAEAVNGPPKRKRCPRTVEEGAFPTCASIGIERDDGDFAILGTLNNADGLMPPEDFKTIVRSLARNIAAATAEPVRAFERQDAPDYVALDGGERLIVEAVDATPAETDCFKITPTNRERALCWLLSELHGGNESPKDTPWNWLQQASIRGSTVTVDANHLRAVLDYLHDSEADHYDPETYPDDVNDHVYAHVLAIEADLKAVAKEGAR